ncbi:MAG: 2-C-methyl-D-erythritol 4-phosphate cytidylyltransferase [Eubacteriales bacterium]|nr:2-C-methyl-D-erythritol 4-phosphate cytidylyltransferase [Eubacteriales bacterium]
MEKSTAIVLSAGSGKRMNSITAKQYLLIKGKPVIYYSLKAFQECPFIDEIILVTKEQDINYCRTKITERYGFTKVKHIISGGKERYHSVYNGLLAAGDCDFVYIHDGARPFVNQNILARSREGVLTYGACVAGMPVKDTIKLSDESGFCAGTPRRSRVWQIQTPQTFSYPLIKEAYEKLMRDISLGIDVEVTDDAQVFEYASQGKVKLVEGAYSNIKITTPEDLKIAESLFG